MHTTFGKDLSSLPAVVKVYAITYRTVAICMYETEEDMEGADEVLSDVVACFKEMQKLAIRTLSQGYQQNHASMDNSPNPYPPRNLDYLFREIAAAPNLTSLSYEGSITRRPSASVRLAKQAGVGLTEIRVCPIGTDQVDMYTALLEGAHPTLKHLSLRHNFKLVDTDETEDEEEAVGRILDRSSLITLDSLETTRYNRDIRLNGFLQRHPSITKLRTAQYSSPLKLKAQTSLQSLHFTRPIEELAVVQTLETIPNPGTLTRFQAFVKVSAPQELFGCLQRFTGLETIEINTLPARFLPPGHFPEVRVNLCHNVLDR